MAFFETFAGLFQALFPRREIRRIYAAMGDRRVTYYLRRDRRFEYVVEKYDATAMPEKDNSVRSWRETYHSEPFASLSAAKASARDAFSWIPAP